MWVKGRELDVGMRNGRIRGQETQISRKKGLHLLAGVQFVESRLVRTSDRDYAGSTTP